MWLDGNHTTPEHELPNTNKKLSELKGKLEPDEARKTFAMFCKANLHFTTSLMTGIDLWPFQEIILRAMMLKDFSLAVCGRGLGKSFIGAILAIHYAIFVPGVKIGICSASFRQARRVFQTIEDMTNAKGGKFLKQCLAGKPSHASDEWVMQIGESKIWALPLGAGDKIRGYRFNLMIIDELLLMSEKVVNEVILPFMAIQMKPRERQALREAQEKLIKAGKLDPKDVIKPSNNRLIGLTSASYQFEYLFSMYTAYEDLIHDRNKSLENNDRSVSHCLFQLSHEMAPPGLYDQKNVDQARAISTPSQFDREYRAQFTSESSGYFSAKLLHECTVPDTQDPHVLVRGREGFEYVLSVDPNFDDSETSDHFAMSLFEMHPDGVDILVHAYAVSKGNIKKRGVYLKYLFDNFDIVYVIADSRGGTRLFNDLNEIDILSKKVVAFEHDFDNKDVEEGIKKSKISYNKTGGKIVHQQVFATNWIREANEFLQISFQEKKMLFASKICTESQINGCRSKKFGVENLWYGEEDKNQRSVDGFVDNLGYLIELTKKETSFIEISSTKTGQQTFDLPANLLKDKTPKRVRKDSYTSLFMGVWGCKCYRAMMSHREVKVNTGFVPFFADRGSQNSF